MNSTSRRPQGAIAINGTRWPATALEVMQTRTASPDTFWAEIPLSVIGDVTGSDVAVQIYLSNDGPAETLVFDGFADNVEISFHSGTVTITGRDKSKKLMDTKARQGFANKKPAEIAQEEASSVGVEVEADEAPELSGVESFGDFTDFVHDQSKWQKMVDTAGTYGMSCYATGGKLYVKKLPEKGLETYEIEYVPPTAQQRAEGDFISLTGTHNLVVANGATVNVNSWNHQNKEAVAGSATAGEGGPTYTYNAPGLTQTQADAVAQKKLNEVTAQGRTISITGPGDVAMHVRKNVKISGTGTSFDTEFETQSLEFRMDSGQGRGAEGFVMTIQAKAIGDKE